jgi:hypothetical protein
MIACLSPNGQNLTRGDTAPTRLLVATLKGINVLERSGPGAPWTDRGRVLDGQHCNSSPNAAASSPACIRAGFFSATMAA